MTKSTLFDRIAASYILGYLMRKPEIVYQNDQYILTIDDFDDKTMKVVFGWIYNLAYNGSQQITPNDVELYAASFPEDYTIIKQEKGDLLIKELYDLVEIPDEKKFDFYYKRMKKFSVLRSLQKNGIDVKDFYNPSFLNTDEEMKKLDELTVEKIINTVRGKIDQINEKSGIVEECEGNNAASGLRSLVKNLQVNPEAGLPLQGNIMNYAARGCRKGKMYMYSSNSGGGKSRYLVSNACGLALPYIENGKVICPEELQKILFIGTEMQIDEIQTLILAFVSGVDEDHILNGTITNDEMPLINAAIELIEQYKDNFVIETLTNPTIQSVSALIRKYILQKDVEYFLL